jgi:predicted RNA binding protein YcfA (HicA-like mRNA interferase family)
MSVKRRDLIKYLEANGFALRREGGNHSIYAKGTKRIPVKRHWIIANQICKQAGLPPNF